MSPASFDTYLREVAALRPAQCNIHGWLTKQGKAAARKALAGFVAPEGLTEVQRWVLGQVLGYVRGESNACHFVPPDPDDPMEQMLAAIACRS